MNSLGNSTHAQLYGNLQIKIEWREVEMCWLGPAKWFANHNDWSRWFAISNLTPIYSPGYSARGGFGKNITN
jgi:hypothetical protein